MGGGVPTQRQKTSWCHSSMRGNLALDSSFGFKYVIYQVQDTNLAADMTGIICRCCSFERTCLRNDPAVCFKCCRKLMRRVCRQVFHSFLDAWLLRPRVYCGHLLLVHHGVIEIVETRGLRWNACPWEGKDTDTVRAVRRTRKACNERLLLRGCSCFFPRFIGLLL